MLVLGVDPGSSVTGYGLVEKVDGQLKYCHDEPDLQISYSWKMCRSLAINGTLIARGVETEPHIVLL